MLFLPSVCFRFDYSNSRCAKVSDMTRLIIKNFLAIDNFLGIKGRSIIHDFYLNPHYSGVFQLIRRRGYIAALLFK